MKGFKPIHILGVICFGGLVFLAATPDGRWFVTYGLRTIASLADAKEAVSVAGAEQRWRDQGVELPLRSPRIVIKKAERELRLFDGEALLATHEVGLGGSPAGHKSREGDSRTPEGTYYVCTRLDRSRFHLFLGLSYPSPEDTTGADISLDQRDAITRAWQRREKPPWDTPLGGAIGIHGGGASSDWTLGCIAIDDEAIEDIFVVAPLGTPVEILP